MARALRILKPRLWLHSTLNLEPIFNEGGRAKMIAVRMAMMMMMMMTTTTTTTTFDDQDADDNDNDVVVVVGILTI